MTCRQASPRRSRPGGTLLEIAVSVAILAVLAAVVYPSFASTQDQKRVTESIAILRELTTVLNRYDTLTSNQTGLCTENICDRSAGRYPGALRHLVDSILGTDLTSCNNSTYAEDGGTDNPTGWRDNGPFWTRDIAAGVGFRIPIGMVHDILVRTPATTAASRADRDREWGLLQIRIDSILAWDLREMEMLVDGDLAGTTGTVRYSGVPNSDSIQQPVFWAFPVGGC